MKYNDFTLLYKDSVTSTNDYILKHCRFLRNKSVIYAGKQSHGRGRQTNEWQSPIGNLYVSLLYKIDISLLPKIPELSQVIALAVKTTTERHLDKSHIVIKWPNDILVNQKKVSGILIETVEQTDSEKKYRNKENENANCTFLNVIIGIGLNLNTDHEFINSINQPATSVYIETGTKVDIKSFLFALLDDIDINMNQWKQHGFDSFFDLWKKCVHIKEKSVVFFNDGQKHEGIIKGIRNNHIQILSNQTYCYKNLHEIIVQ